MVPPLSCKLREPAWDMERAERLESKQQVTAGTKHPRGWVMKVPEETRRFSRTACGSFANPLAVPDRDAGARLQSRNRTLLRPGRQALIFTAREDDRTLTPQNVFCVS